MVNKDTGQLVANGLVDEHGGDGRINAAGQTADHPPVADLLADGGNGLILVGGHGPVAVEACKFHKILVERLAMRGVMHFRVKLDRVEIAAVSAVMAKGALGDVP